MKASSIGCVMCISCCADFFKSENVYLLLSIIWTENLSRKVKNVDDHLVSNNHFSGILHPKITCSNVVLAISYE